MNRILTRFLKLNTFLVAAGISLFSMNVLAQGYDGNSVSKVLMPYSDFKQIINSLKSDSTVAKPLPQLPAQFVVSEVQLWGEVKSERECQFTAQVTANVLDDKAWLEIPLGRGMWIYPDIRINNSPGQAGMKDDGTVFFLMNGKGKKVIRYRFSAPLTRSSGQTSLAISLPGQAASKIDLNLDGPGYKVVANGRPLLFGGKRGSGFVYEGGLGSGTSATVTWEQMAANSGSSEPLITANVNSMYTVGMDFLHVRSQLNLNVIHNDINRISFTVPKRLDVVDLTGRSVASWESKDTAGSRLIIAYLKYDVRDNVSFNLDAEMGFSDSLSQLQLPTVTVNGVIRQEGTIGVGVMSSVELKTLHVSNNVLRRDKRELPRWFSDQSEVIHVYQYLSDKYRIQMQLTHHDHLPVLDALITNASYKSMIRNDGKMITLAILNVRNRGEQFLRLGWKEEFQLWSVYCNNEPGRPSLDTSSGELLIPLKRSQEEAAETSVRIVYLSERSAFGLLGKQKVDYPKVNMPVQNFNGTVFIPENIRPFRVGGSLYQKGHQSGPGWFRSVFLGLNDRKPEVYRYRGETGITTPSESGSQVRSAKMEVKQSGKSGENWNLSQIQNSNFEAGILSIPVKLNFEGKAIPLSSPMLRKADNLSFSFWFHTLPDKNIWVFQMITLFFLITAGVVLTKCVVGGTTRKLVIYGMILPLSISLCLQRFIGKPLNLDIMFMVPLGYLAFCIVKRVSGHLKKNKSEEKSEDQNEIQGKTEIESTAEATTGSLSHE
ncbi:MAG: hypothetical protein ACOC36_02165 [Fibrobacterota bacterium]